MLAVYLVVAKLTNYQQYFIANWIDNKVLRHVTIKALPVIIEIINETVFVILLEWFEIIPLLFRNRYSQSSNKYIIQYIMNESAMENSSEIFFIKLIINMNET